MNILFVGQYYPDQLLNELKKYSKGGLDFAAHNLHKALFKGFEDNKVQIDILNYPHLGSFPPYYRKPFVPSCCDVSNHLNSISYVNISFFKRYDIKRKIYSNIEEWCCHKDGRKIIILYNFECVELAAKIKSTYENVKVCLIVTDLKEYMIPRQTVLTRINTFATNLFTPENTKWYDSIDSYILLAEKMKERLPIGNKPWILMEGIYNSEYIAEDIPKESNKTIMYTGNLGKRYGIIELIDAFEQIESNEYRLWIRGNGDSLEYVKKIGNRDPRIKIFDVLSRHELVRLQKRATILINPVSPKEDFTSYFFPSKTLEYLASGTPTLMFRLNCLPKEYYKHLYFIEEDTVGGIKDALVNVCSQPQEKLNAFGEKAISFILENKCPKVQVRRLIDFFKTL